MKTLKNYSTVNMIIIYAFILFMILSCGQSVKSPEVKETASTETKASVKAPEVDLQTAIITGDLEAVQKHIAAGSDINKKDPMSGSTPLITAASFDKTKIAEALINASADLTPKNNDGSTALHAAAFFCNVEIVQLLIDAKADKSVKNNFGATPRETVTGPFEAVKPVYEMLQQQLGPLGLQIDLKEIEKTRPVIAMMLQ
ncbi:ankyrin repeat domain-containing protein [Robertkochia solimangrovi]|uniref:ankyrin repeat domain-containing protein n=1 Tax=Robertkochia solimangrovi TaxID=2213046 RepID=UPI00117CF713|nr:ankyrin repeat domain-containing protein [Robertkochia solimangrovi]TRZ45430.1 ankyrin repeat domain-containing protein [Robertkochia solimangrovi]